MMINFRRLKGKASGNHAMLAPEKSEIGLNKKRVIKIFCVKYFVCNYIKRQSGAQAPEKKSE